MQSLSHLAVWRQADLAVSGAHSRGPSRVTRDVQQCGVADPGRWEKTRTAKVALIESVAAGKAVGVAREELDISLSRYTKWRQVDPEFRDRIDHARESTRHLHASTGMRNPFDAAKAKYLEGVPGDFSGFVGKFFPDRSAHLPHQLRLVRELQTLQPREVVLFLLWPEAGKTATLEDYMCRKLALQPSHRFRVVSQTDQHSKRIIGFLQSRFTDTSEWPEFIGRFGPFVEKNQERSGRPWNQNEITVFKSTSRERDRSVVATSWRGATTGSRIDTLILDDVQTPENYNQADEIFNRIRSTFFTRGLEMRTLIIGNRVGPGDVYDRMLDAGLITKDPIILPAAGGWGAEPGMPTIPEWWDRHNLTHAQGEKPGPCCGGISPFRTCPKNGERLTPVEYMDLLKHQVGEKAWASLYAQDPLSDSLTSFGEYINGCLDEDRTLGPLVGV